MELSKPPERAPRTSIMMIVATDLALDARQLEKVAKRAAIGLERTGSYGGHSSGDLTIAFTTGQMTVEGLIDAEPGLGRMDFGGDSSIPSSELPWGAGTATLDTRSPWTRWRE